MPDDRNAPERRDGGQDGQKPSGADKYDVSIGKGARSGETKQGGQKPGSGKGG